LLHVDLRLGLEQVAVIESALNPAEACFMLIFHWVKCRFNDCNLLQTKRKINMKQASASPTAAEEKAIEDKKELDDWGKQGNVTPAYNDKEKHGQVVAYAQTSEANQNKNKNKQTIKGKVQAATKK
jgi:hypothetical protein